MHKYDKNDIIISKFKLHSNTLIMRDWHKTKSFNNFEYFTAETHKHHEHKKNTNGIYFLPQ
jgi:hypothetical protein